MSPASLAARAISTGLITGGAMDLLVHTGASTQAVTTGAGYRAVEFIKKNIKLEGVGEGILR